MSVFKVPPAWLTYTIAGAAAFALLPLPYGYYQLLRLIVSGYAAYLAWQYFQHYVKKWSWAFTFVAILYNPVFIIAMSKNFHSLVNLATTGLILWDLRVNLTTQKGIHNQEARENAQTVQPDQRKTSTKQTDNRNSGFAVEVLIACLAVALTMVATSVYVAC